jgi:hypothetical protein
MKVEAMAELVALATSFVADQAATVATSGLAEAAEALIVEAAARAVLRGGHRVPLAVSLAAQGSAAARKPVRCLAQGALLSRSPPCLRWNSSTASRSMSTPDLLYATDSTTGTVRKVSPGSGSASLWADGEALEPSAGGRPSGFGANGIKVHNDAVWVSNTDKGTLLRITIGAHSTAGAVTTEAEGLTSIDDFTLVGQGHEVLAAENFANAVALVSPDGTHTTVLTAVDGLSGPTSLAVRGNPVYVASAAYFTRTDPNLLLARIAR